MDVEADVTHVGGVPGVHVEPDGLPGQRVITHVEDRTGYQQPPVAVDNRVTSP